MFEKPQRKEGANVGDEKYLLAGKLTTFRKLKILGDEIDPSAVVISKAMSF